MKKRILILLLSLTSFGSVFGLDEYFEPFSAPGTACGVSGNWCMNFPYGRGGYFQVSDRGFGQTPFLSISQDTANFYGIAPVSTGYLFVQGEANNQDLAYNNIFTGRASRLDTLYNASVTQPFGFQVVRYFSVIDPADREDGTSYQRSTLNIWLVQNNSVASETNFSDPASLTTDWSTIPNAIYFYEMQINLDTQPTWGYFSGSDVNLNSVLATAPRTNLSGTDNIGGTNNGLIFENNDATTLHNGRLIISRSDAGGTMSTACASVGTTFRGYNLVKTNNTTPPHCGLANRREVGIRMTHNGTSASFYMNPNPHGRTGTFNGVDYTAYRNEWYKVGTQNVAFSTNMKVMIGQENLHFVNGLTEAVYDNFLVRPVAQSITTELLQPLQGTDHRVLQSSAQQYGVKLTPTFATEDAGIGEIYIKKPSSVGELFNGVNWARSNVLVCLDNNATATSGASCNDPGETLITYLAASNNLTDNSTLGATQFQAYTLNSDFTLAAGDAGDILAIRLKKTSGASNNIFRDASAGAHIRVYFTLSAANTSFTGNDFQVWAHNEKFHDTAQEYRIDGTGLRYATTEKMLVSASSAGALTVKAYTQPAATLAVSASPNPLFWGTLLPFMTLEIRTPTSGTGTDITRLVLQLPAEGDITPFDFELHDGSAATALIDSLKIADTEEVFARLRHFTDTTSTIDDCIAATYTYCYYTNSGNANYRKLVINYGNTYKIPGANGYDRLTFFMKQAPTFNAGDQITAQWSAQADSTGFITGTSLQALTAYQATAAYMQTIVRAQEPVTAGSLTPTILSNNVSNANPTTGLITYTVKNLGSTSNTIKRVELLIPYVTYNSVAGDTGHPFSNENFRTPIAGDFTNFKVNGSGISPTVTVIGNENISGTDYRVVRVEPAAPLAAGSSLTMDVSLNYYRNTNLASQAFSIKHRTDNENYSAPPAYPYPRYKDGGEDPNGSWTLSLTPPEPRGEAFVFRGTQSDSPARVFTNEIVSGNITNIQFKVYNRGGIGNDIRSLELFYPDYLTIADTCSAYLNALGVVEKCISDAGSNIVNDTINHKITIDYNTLGQDLKSAQDTVAATPCAGETNVPCEIITVTVAQDAALADPTLTDSVKSITDANSDGIYETVSASTDGQANIRTGTFYAKLNNPSGAASYARQSTGKSQNLTLEYPDPALQAFITSDTAVGPLNEADATLAQTTMKVYMKNMAQLAGNNIYRTEIKFPDSPAIVTGTPAVVSFNRDFNGSVTAKSSGTHYSASWNVPTQTLTIDYVAGQELPASLANADATSYVDIVEIQYTDTVTASGLQVFTVTGYNKVGAIATGKSIAASVYDGTDTDDTYNDANNQDIALGYKIPQGLGTGTIEPKVAYTTTGTFSMQSRFFLKNTALASTTNRTFKVQLTLPAGVTVASSADVTARAGTTINCLGGNGFTGGCVGAGESIELDYTTATPQYLDPASDADDEVLVVWSHSSAAEGPVQFGINFDNNDGGGYSSSNLEAIPASLRTVEIYNAPTMKIEVISKPGDPTSPASLVNNQNVRSTVPNANYHRFKLTVNANLSGPKIHRLRISPPAMFDTTSLDASDLLPAGTTMSQSGGYLYADFSAGQLSAASAVLEFRLKDNRSFNIPGTNSNDDDASWTISADFFSDIYTNALYSNTNLPGPSFAGKLVADTNDDDTIYVPTTSYATARAIDPVAGTGDATLAWNITRMSNPSPKFVMYVKPAEVFRINSGDPDYNFTQSIYVENKGEADNDIRIAQFKPSAGFLTYLGACTNLASCDLATAAITVKKGTTGTPETGWSTLSYGTDYTLSSVESGNTNYTLANPQTVRIVFSEASRITSTQTVLISFAAKHGQTNTGSQPWTLQAGNYNATVSPINGDDPVPLGQTAVTSVVTPSYTANFILESINGVTGTDSISAASSQNTFIYKLTNNSSGGDALTQVKIVFPGYFDVAGATITSSQNGTVSRTANATHYDTSGISTQIPANETNSFNKGNFIQLVYSPGLPAGTTDTITITISDSFFPSTPVTIASRADSGGYIERSGTPTEVTGDSIGNDDGICDAGEVCQGGPVTVKASAQYDTSGGAFSYIQSFPSGGDRLKLVQPVVQANAWLISTEAPLDGTGPRTQTLELRVKNNSATATAGGNILYRAKIELPRSISTGVLSASNAKWRRTGETSYNTLAGSCDNVPTCSGVFTGTGSGYYLYVDFEPQGGLLPQETAEILFDYTENFPSSFTGYTDIAVRTDNHASITATGLPDSGAYIANSTSMVNGTGLSTELTTQTLRLNFVAPDPASEGFIAYSVDPEIVIGERVTTPTPKFQMKEADLVTLGTYCNPATPNLTDTCDARYTVYAIGEYADIYYELKNGSQNYALEEAKIRLSIFDYNTTVDWSQFTITEVESAHLGVIPSPTITDYDLYNSSSSVADDALGADGGNETKEIAISYSASPLAVAAIDTVRIRIKFEPSLTASHLTITDATGGLTLSTNYTSSGKATAFDYTKNVEFKVSAQVKRQSVAGFRNVDQVTGKQHYMYVRRAGFARISGQVAPKEAPLSFQLQTLAGATATMEGGGTMPTVGSRAASTETYARFVFDRIPIGQTYNIQVASADAAYEAQTYVKIKSEAKTVAKSAFSVSANTVTKLPDILPGPFEMVYKQLNAAVDNSLKAPLDPKTSLVLPAGALDNNPRINIRIEQTAQQVWGVLSQIADQASANVTKGTANGGTHNVYNLVNELPDSGQMTPVIENQLKGEATLTLGYENAMLTANGWNATSLAIFYWEFTRKKWIKIGGTVDVSAGTVTAKISYMNRTYSLFPSEKSSLPISNVTVFPRVFTPGRTDSYYVEGGNVFGGEKTFGNLKLTFELASSSIGKKYEVAIYDMKGKLIKTWDKTNDSGQGSVFWDGRDTAGALVSGGVYMYVVRIEGEKYRGTLVVAR